MGTLSNSKESVNVVSLFGATGLENLLSVSSGSVSDLETMTEKEFRAKVLNRYTVMPFGTFADWLPSKQAKEYKQALQAEASKLKRPFDWDMVSPVVYDKLKQDHDTKEEKRVIKFSLSDMVGYIDNNLSNEFISLVGVSASDVVLSGDLTKYSVIGDKLSSEPVKGSDLFSASACLAALLSYKIKRDNDTMMQLDVSAKVGRYYLKCYGAASDAIKLQKTKDQFLADCAAQWDKRQADNESNKKTLDQLHINIAASVSRWWAIARESVTFKHGHDMTKAINKKKLAKYVADLKQLRSALNTAYTLEKQA